MLTAKTVTRKLPEYNDVMKLIGTAFPQNEIVPLPWLKMLAFKKNVDFFAFYDSEIFVGTVYMVRRKELTYILYIAVDDTARRRGYGSQILSWVRDVSMGKPIVLDAETLDPFAENAEERAGRMEFYLSNGFHDTGYILKDSTGTYSLLTDGAHFDPKAYMRTIRSLAMKLYRPKLTKAEEYVNRTEEQE